METLKRDESESSSSKPIDYSLEKVVDDSNSDQVSYLVKSDSEVIGRLTVESSRFGRGYRVVTRSDSENYDIPDSIEELKSRNFESEDELIEQIEDEMLENRRESLFYDSSNIRVRREDEKIYVNDGRTSEEHKVSGDYTAGELLEKASKESWNLRKLGEKLEPANDSLYKEELM